MTERQRFFVRPFRNGTTAYVAYGDDESAMPVFLVQGTGHSRTRLHYPSCIRFMPEAELGQGQRLTMAQIRRRYGAVLSPRDIDAELRGEG